jgi:hypothetical protein
MQEQHISVTSEQTANEAPSLDLWMTRLLSSIDEAVQTGILSSGEARSLLLGMDEYLNLYRITTEDSTDQERARAEQWEPVLQYVKQRYQWHHMQWREQLDTIFAQLPDVVMPLKQTLGHYPTAQEVAAAIDASRRDVHAVYEELNRRIHLISQPLTPYPSVQEVAAALNISEHRASIIKRAYEMIRKG